MLRLVRYLPDFAYDPSRSFRGWLRTLTAQSWSGFIRNQVRGIRGAADPVIADRLDTVAARVDLVRHLEETYDQELLELAMAEVRERVEPHTWEAFRLTAIEGAAVAKVAARLGIAVATVYRARHVVQQMLRQVVARLDRAEDAPR
jgi:RNA polymerase sigma-70 factor (ECF subfamily)